MVGDLLTYLLPGRKWRLLEDEFPFTCPSIQAEVPAAAAAAAVVAAAAAVACAVAAAVVAAAAAVAAAASAADAADVLCSSPLRFRV